jgi:hypothetical protein
MRVADLKSMPGLKDSFNAALRQARIAEAAHLDSALDIRDAQTLRLQALKLDLMGLIEGHAEALKFFDLAVVQGDPPRLWIDLITAVIMDPNPRTFRLYQDTQDGRETLFETDNRTEMVERIKTYMAHRLIARERQMAGHASGRGEPQGFSMAALLLAWLTGLVIGALGLFAAGVLLSKVAS